VRPLPANKLFTACLIVCSTGWTKFRVSWVRTCSWAGQILLLRALLLVRLCVARRRQRLAIRAVHGRRLPDTTPDCVSRNKRLSLCRDGSENAVLVESHAVGASAVLGRLETRASDLQEVSGSFFVSIAQQWTYLAAPAVPTGNSSALARSWWLVMLLDILRRRGRLTAIWILGRRAPIPLVGPRETVGLLVLRMLVGSHVGARLLRWWRWEGGSHLWLRSNVSGCSTAYGRHVRRVAGVSTHDQADVHVQAADMSRWRAAVRWVVANG
jgi:hypothetical protein